MAVNTNKSRMAPYVGAGSTGPYAFDFKIYLTTDLVVQQLVVATGVLTTLVMGAGTGKYVVTLSGASPNTGYITLGTALPVGTNLLISRVLPITQLITLIDNEGTPAATYVEGYDRLCMVAQQLQEQLNRGVFQLPTYSTPLYLPVPVAGKALKWNSTADGLENTTVDIDSAIAAAAASAAAAAISAAAALVSQNAAAVSAAAALASQIAAAAIVAGVRGTFVNADLASGFLTITHNKALSAPYTVALFVNKNTGEKINPPYICYTNTVVVDLNLWGTLTGTWGYVVI